MSVTVSGCDWNNPRMIGEHKCPASVHLTDSGEFEDEFDHPLYINWCNMNAASVLSLLGLYDPQDGLCSGCTVAEARRAVMVARATFEKRAGRFTRDEERVYGKPRTNEDGTVELRPLRVFGGGIDTEYLRRQVERFAEFVEYVAGRGATHISWG